MLRLSNDNEHKLHNKTLNSWENSPTTTFNGEVIKTEITKLTWFSNFIKAIANKKFNVEGNAAAKQTTIILTIGFYLKILHQIQNISSTLN